MRADPDDGAQEQDDQGRDAPDQQLQASGEIPLRQVARLGVRGAEPPGEDHGGDHRRDDDGQHDGQGVQGDHGVGPAHRTVLVEHVVPAACQQRGETQRREAGQASTLQLSSVRLTPSRHPFPLPHRRPTNSSKAIMVGPEPRTVQCEQLGRRRPGLWEHCTCVGIGQRNRGASPCPPSTRPSPP